MKIIVHENDLLILEATILNEDLLNGGEIFFGRDDDCHIQLDSHKVSRHHAVLSYSDGALKIRSLSEFKKVRLLGNDVLEASVQNGSQISIDTYTITLDNFEVGDIAPEIAEESVASENTSELEEEVVAPISENEEIEELEPELESEEDESFDNGDDTDVMDTLSETNDLGSSLDDELISDIDDVEESEEESNFSEESDESFDNESDFGDSDEGFGGEEDAFGDSSDSFGGDDDSSTQVFQSFASYKLKIFGEYAPFDTFSIVDPTTQIGRDPATCKIVLSDPEVSKVHAIIKKTLINLTIEDNESSNGIILNGERVNKAELNNGDEFIIGETTFTVNISSDLLDQEQGRLMPVEEDQEVIIESDGEMDGLDFDNSESENLDFATGISEVPVEEEKSFIKKIWKDPRKRLYAIVGIVLFALLFLVDDSEVEVTDDDSPAVTTKASEGKPKPKRFTKEVQDIIDQNYALALAKYNNDQFYQAKEYINTVKKYDPTYKLTASLDKSIQESLDAITRAKEDEEKQKERLIKQKRVEELVLKAKEAVKERKVKAAKAYFSNIYELDPENIDVPPLKIEIDSFVEEKERKKQEAKIAATKRQNMVDKLAPGKQLYLKEEWYKAISKLEAFLRLKGMDEDLIKSGTDMLTESKRKLSRSIDPLISKARSFKEGQDLKQSFETYGEVLKFDPSNEESLNERAEIFETLEKRSKILYREALIKEDLSDFSNAKEKFQEVQQISPINSEYYTKATDKLKNYLE